MSGRYNGFVFQHKDTSAGKLTAKAPLKTAVREIEGGVPIFSFSVKEKEPAKKDKDSKKQIKKTPVKSSSGLRGGRVRGAAPRDSGTRDAPPTRKKITEEIRPAKPATPAKKPQGPAAAPLFRFSLGSSAAPQGISNTTGANKPDLPKVEQKRPQMPEIATAEQKKAPEQIEPPKATKRISSTDRKSKIEKTHSAEASENPSVTSTNSRSKEASLTSPHAPAPAPSPIPALPAIQSLASSGRASLGTFSGDRRRTSVFKTRRESLFGYDQIYNGSVLPSDFHKHSNDSQDRKARIKQILLWITKYVSNGHAKIKDVPPERVEEVCKQIIGKIPHLELSPPPPQVEHVSEEVKETIREIESGADAYAKEISAWQKAYSDILRRYSVSVPFEDIETAKRFSLRRCSVARSIGHSVSRSFDQSSFGGVSFDSTYVQLDTPREVASVLVRKLEELLSSLNSTRYFIFLSFEYTRKVSEHLLNASYPIEKSKANAILQVLCRTTKKKV